MLSQIKWQLQNGSITKTRVLLVLIFNYNFFYKQGATNKILYIDIKT